MKKMNGYKFFFPLILIGSQDIIENNKEITILYNKGKKLSNDYFIDFFELFTSDKICLNQIFSYLMKDIILFHYKKFNSKTINIKINVNDNLLTNLPSKIILNKDKHECIGKIIYNDKSVYKGYIISGKKEKKGKMSYKNEIYLLKTNKKRSKTKKCFMYEGNWENDKWNGLGICYLKNSQYLEGFFFYFVLKINNKFIYDNGDEYEGNLIELKRNGFGMMKYKNGEIYIGNWNKNLRNGHGKIIYNNAIFEGNFVKDKKEKGIFYSNNEDYLFIQKNKDKNFENLFRNNQIKGIVYEGSFKNNNLNGIVSYINGDEYYYYGNYENNKKNGRGRIIYKNGDEYNGNFKNDKKEGYGVLNFSNGKVYSGLFKNDQILENEKKIIINEINNIDYFICSVDDQNKKILTDEQNKKILTDDNFVNNNVTVIKMYKEIKPLYPLKKCIIR